MPELPPARSADVDSDVQTRPLTVCADDFGLAPGIDEAILDLVDRGRLAAVSGMVLGRSWSRSASSLRAIRGNVEVGLHFTLTHLAPAGPLPRLAPHGQLPALAALVRSALLRRLDAGEIATEMQRQIDRFEAAMGAPPDFIDGHQHVHQLPGVRDAVLAVVRHRLADRGAWLRYPSMPPGDAFIHGVAIARSWAVSALGLGFRDAGARLGIAGNGTFRGIRAGVGGPRFAELFRRFVRRLGARPLLMCHPGLEGDPFVADQDGATAARRDEHAFLASDEFLACLAERRLRITGLRRRRDPPMSSDV
jgi:hypothetical protein